MESSMEKDSGSDDLEAVSLVTSKDFVKQLYPSAEIETYFKNQTPSWFVVQVDGKDFHHPDSKKVAFSSVCRSEEAAWDDAWTAIQYQMLDKLNGH